MSFAIASRRVLERPHIERGGQLRVVFEPSSYWGTFETWAAACRAFVTELEPDLVGASDWACAQHFRSWARHDYAKIVRV